jgi:hypothetical protein
MLTVLPVKSPLTAHINSNQELRDTAHQASHIEQVFELLRPKWNDCVEVRYILVEFLVYCSLK